MVYYALYLFSIAIWCPVLATLSGGQRLQFGTSVFWIPKQKAQVVRDGIELLQSRDVEIFSRLTSKQHLIIYYFEGSKLNRKSSHRLFFMHSNFIEMGPEGVDRVHFSGPVHELVLGHG